MTSSMYSVNVVRDALLCAGNYLHSDLILSAFMHTRIYCPTMLVNYDMFLTFFGFVSCFCCPICIIPRL